MKITVIIPSLYDVDKEYLKLCVESLRATVDWDIVVVTNGGHQPFFEPEGITGVTKHLHTRDQGQCNAVNIGAQAAEPNTDYLFIINSDMYFGRNWTQYLRFDYPVFSPNLVEPTDNAGSAQPFLKGDFGNTLEVFRRSKAELSLRLWQGIAHGDKQDIMGNDLPEGAVNIAAPNGTEEPGFNFPVFIRKDVWDTIGGYDTAYDPWGSNSDTDLQTAINIAGITPMRLRDVLVYHFSNKSGTFDGTHQDFYQNNIEYFKQKFGFDRDELKSDVWYNKKMLPKDPEQIKFKPEWAGKYV